MNGYCDQLKPGYHTTANGRLMLSGQSANGAYLVDEAIKYQEAARELYASAEGWMGSLRRRDAVADSNDDLTFYLDAASKAQWVAARASEQARFYLFRLLGDDAQEARANAYPNERIRIG